MGELYWRGFVDIKISGKPPRQWKRKVQADIWTIIKHFEMHDRNRFALAECRLMASRLVELPENCIDSKDDLERYAM